MIILKNLNKFYSKKQVLFGMNLKISTDKNHISALIGPNGAGKTTLLKVLSGIYLAEDNTISTDEAEYEYSKWAKENVAYVAADNRVLYMKNTAFDNIMYYACLKGVSTKEAHRYMEQYEGYFNIEGGLHSQVENLSFGNQKKVCLLAALCSNKNIIILDEPSVGLDIETIEDFCELVKSLAEVFHKTFIVSSHDLDFVSRIANHYIFIREGKIINEVTSHLELEEIYKMHDLSKMMDGGV